MGKWIDGRRTLAFSLQRPDNRKRLWITLWLIGGYMMAEVIGGLLTGSLALLADAGHMLSDFGALALSLFAMEIARRPVSPRRSYGYYRAEVLAALFNGMTLVGISVYIFYESIGRFRDPPQVAGGLMLAIASGGLLVNLVGLKVLNAGKTESLNVRGAWLHVLTDALGSVGAIVAGTLIWAFNWQIADPIASIVIGLLVLYSSWALLRESIDVLMESAPKYIDPGEVQEAVGALAGIHDVHDLHIWTITSGMHMLTCHVRVAADQQPADVLYRMRKMINEHFGIEHITVQTEPLDFDEPAHSAGI